MDSVKLSMLEEAQDGNNSNPKLVGSASLESLDRKTSLSDVNQLLADLDQDLSFIDAEWSAEGSAIVLPSASASATAAFSPAHSSSRVPAASSCAPAIGHRTRSGSPAAASRAGANGALDYWAARAKVKKQAAATKKAAEDKAVRLKTKEEATATPLVVKKSIEKAAEGAAPFGKNSTAGAGNRKPHSTAVSERSLQQQTSSERASPLTQLSGAQLQAAALSKDIKAVARATDQKAAADKKVAAEAANKSPATTEGEGGAAVKEKEQADFSRW